MENYTVVYQGENNGYQAFHVANATSEKLQKAFNEANVQIIEHIMEQRRNVAVNDFMVYATESEIKNFLDKWQLVF